MRSLRTCLLALCLASLAAGAAALEAVVRKPGIDVLAEPRLDAAVVAKLARDAAVTITSQSGLWYQLALVDGRSGYVRVNDLRLNYAGTEGGDANLRALTGGKAGQGRVTETAGVRGLDRSELAAASTSSAGLNALVSYRVPAPVARQFAFANAWQATRVPLAGEAAPPRPASRGAVSGADAIDAAEEIGGLAGGVGQSLGALFGTARKAAPRPEQDLAAEELALGPEIAGRVLGARPLWQDAGAQRRVNLVGRWVASQTTRADLPWTFGIIDSPEINAFAAPGGFVLLTRGLYELVGSDDELAAVLGHEISHCVQRDHYTVIRQQQLASLGKDELSSRIQGGSSRGEALAREYAGKHGAEILLTSLDREAEFRADLAAEVYVARAGMNPLALYSVLQKMLSLGEKSAGLAQLYSTHPPLHARLDRIDARGYGELAPYVTR